MMEKLMKSMTDEQLFDVWEMTTDMHDANIAMVRGWLMDEIEARFPEAFEEWLDSECPDDASLRGYAMPA